MAQGVKLAERVYQHIARLARAGKTGNQIAKDLGIARSTVQEHLKRLREDAEPSHGQGHAARPEADPFPAPLASVSSESSPVALVIDREFQGLMPASTGEARAQLEASPREEGCRDPLVIWPQPAGAPILLDGHHRYEICQQYGLAFAVVEARGIRTRDDAKIWIINNQLGRRNLTDFQRIELAERLRPLLAAKAKAKQQKGGREKVPQNLAELVETLQAIAAVAGVSRETVRKAEAIMEEADEPTKEALRRGERSIHGVYVDLRPRRPRVDDGPTPVDTWLKVVRELCALLDSLEEQGGMAAIAQRWSPAGQAELLEELEALTTPLVAMVDQLRAVCATIDVPTEGQ